MVIKLIDKLSNLIEKMTVLLMEPEKPLLKQPELNKEEFFKLQPGNSQFQLIGRFRKVDVDKSFLPGAQV